MNEVNESLRGRIFNIKFILENNDIDVTSIIEQGLSHKSIDKWFVLTVPLIEENNKRVKNTPCVELFIKCSSNVKITSIEKWFTFGNVVKLTGQNSFIKGIYNVMCIPSYYSNKSFINDNLYRYGAGTDSNFDWLKEVLEYEAKLIKNSVENNMPKLERMKFNDIHKGKTLKECSDDDSELYISSESVLQRLRLANLYSESEYKPLNYYIYGNKGTGSEVYSKILARSLYPNLSDEDLIYSVSYDCRKGFLGYDGQPVVIYNGFNNINNLVEVAYKGSYDSFSGAFNLGQGISGKVNIIISDVPFETFFNDYFLKQEDVFDYFPLTNIIVLNEDEFLKKFNYRKTILKKSPKILKHQNLFNS